jgi:hypothetical protein
MTLLSTNLLKTYNCVLHLVSRNVLLAHNDFLRCYYVPINNDFPCCKYSASNGYHNKQISVFS